MSKYEKIISSLMYLFFGLGGVVSLFFPYKVILGVANHQTALIWAGLMALGGIISFIGVLKDSWTLEQTGLPLLVMCFSTLAIVAVSSYFAIGEYYFSSALFSLGNVSFFVSRYLRIKKSIVPE